MTSAGVPKLAKRLSLDLTNTFAGDGEMLAHLFERVLAPILQAEAHLDDFLFTRA